MFISISAQNIRPNNTAKPTVGPPCGCSDDAR